MATFTCNHGYSLSGSSSRTCQTSGNWEQPIPTCTQSTKHIFSNICLFQYLTDLGLIFIYLLLKDEFLESLYIELKIFILVTCTGLSLSNGGVSYNRHAPSPARYPVDTVATFACDRGYSLSGSSSRSCQTSGSWNQSTPTCNQSKANKIKLLSPKF